MHRWRVVHTFWVVCIAVQIFLECSYAYGRSSSRAVRRGASATTLRDTRIGASIGGQISYLRTGKKTKWSNLFLGYSYGFDLVVPINDFFDFELSTLASWKGGRVRSALGAASSALDVKGSVQIMSLDIGLYANYIQRLHPDVDIFVGVGMLPQMVLMGRMALDFAGGSQRYDLDVGFDAKSHLFPLNFGLATHFGIQYLSSYTFSLWFDYDFLNLLPKQKRFYGEITPDYLLRHDVSRPFIQSLERLSTLAFGLKFTYYIKL